MNTVSLPQISDEVLRMLAEKEKQLENDIRNRSAASENFERCLRAHVCPKCGKTLNETETKRTKPFLKYLNVEDGIENKYTCEDKLCGFIYSIHLFQN